MTTNQIAKLFGRERSNINRHINNLYKNEELDKASTCVKFAQVEKEKDKYGNYREVLREDREYFNLDIILAVGYKVNSKEGIAFRKWVSNILKEYMIQGYVLNEKRLELQNKVIEIQSSVLSGVSSMAGLDAADMLKVINEYTSALELLDKYDHQCLLKPEGSKCTYELSYVECKEIINAMAFESGVFGVEKEVGKVEGILAAVYQNVFVQEVYPTLEEKAANLLYFFVKDHPFADGCKRISAALFIEFLNRNNALYRGKRQIISNSTLVAITLMVAESKPEEKEIMINLIMNFLKA